MEKFFRLGNLIALRELSMRRAAARVDDEMRDYMETRAIPGPWPAAERLLVCVSGSPFSERLIRTTRRLADEMKPHGIRSTSKPPAPASICGKTGNGSGKTCAWPKALGHR